MQNLIDFMHNLWPLRGPYKTWLKAQSHLADIPRIPGPLAAILRLAEAQRQQDSNRERPIGISSLESSPPLAFDVTV
jgi:hypothetical protein